MMENIYLQSVNHNQPMVELPNGGIMPESEYKVMLNILNSDQQPVKTSSSITTKQQKTDTDNNWLSNITGRQLLSIGMLLSGSFIGILCILKVAGSTDIAQQSAFRSDIDNQYRQLGERYDRLAELAEKAAERPNICVSLVCNSKDKNDEKDHRGNGRRNASFTTTPIYNSELPNLTRKVASWKLDGVSREQAFQQLAKVPTDQREIYFQAINNIYGGYDD